VNRKTTKLSNGQVWTLYNRTRELLENAKVKTHMEEREYYLIPANELERTLRYLEKLKEEM